jgi:tetratricopeptide (TPR) repeat protein
MKRFSTRLLAAALALLFVAQADALAKDTWTSVRTQNFHLVGNASEKEIRQVATRLEQFRHAFSRIFRRARLTDSVPTTVVVFKDQDAYKPYNPGGHGGYFQPGEDVNYITLASARRQSDENPFGTIFHEYVHLLVKNNLSGTAPAWLDEGLAEFYSTLEVQKGGEVADVGRPIAPHVFYLREQKMLPLRTLLAVDHSSPHYNEKSKRGVFYAQSWALVHYLMLGNERKRAPQLTRYLQLVGGGTSQQQSFESAFGADAEAIEKELRDYIRKDRYPYLSSPLDEKQEADSSMRSEPLTEAQALAYLGDLALHTRLLDLAEANLQKAVALDEGNQMARASLGMLRMRQGRLDEAREHLRRAVAADARNHLAHYYYAYALSREGMSGMNYVSSYAPERAAEMRAALRKAIELKPDFAGSYHLLAFVNLVTGEQLEESVALLRKAIQLAPGEEQFHLALAQIHLRREEFDAARKIVEPLANSAPDPQTRAGAQSVLNSIKNYQEQVERYKSLRDSASGGGGAAGASGDAGPPRLMRRQASDGTPEPGEADATGMTEEEAMAAALREALRKPQAGETRAVGLLTRVECGPKGATFHVRVGADVLKLQGGDMSGVQFMAFTPEAGSQVGCGQRKPESRVVVTYRAREKGAGELVAVEFVPAKFELK